MITDQQLFDILEAVLLDLDDIRALMRLGLHDEAFAVLLNTVGVLDVNLQRFDFVMTRERYGPYYVCQ